MMMRTVVYPQILKRPAPLIESWQTSDIMNKTSPCCGTERLHLQNYGSDLYGIIMKNIQLFSNTTESLSLNKEYDRYDRPIQNQDFHLLDRGNRVVDKTCVHHTLEQLNSIYKIFSC